MLNATSFIGAVAYVGVCAAAVGAGWPLSGWRITGVVSCRSGSRLEQFFSFRHPELMGRYISCILNKVHNEAPKRSFRINVVITMRMAVRMTSAILSSDLKKLVVILHRYTVLTFETSVQLLQQKRGEIKQD